MRTYYAETNWILTPVDTEKAELAGFDPETKHFIRVSVYFKNGLGEKPTGYYVRFEINPHHDTQAELTEEHLLVPTSRRAYSTWCEARMLVNTIGCKKLAVLLEKIGLGMELLREGQHCKACAMPFVSDDEAADPKNTAILVDKFLYGEVEAAVEAATNFPKRVIVLQLANKRLELAPEKIILLKNL